MSEAKAAKKIEMIVTAAARGSKIIVDGKEIPYVRRAELILDASDASVLKLEMFCLDGAVAVGECPVEITPVGTTGDVTELVRAARIVIENYKALDASLHGGSRLESALDPFELVPVREPKT